MKTDEHEYVKCSQNNYSMNFNLAVVREYEISKISLKALSIKYSILI